MHKARRVAPAMVLAAAMCGVSVGSLSAQDIQPAPLITEPMPVELDSGLVSNRGADEEVIFSQTIFVPGAAALRLEFDEVVLSGLVSDGSASYLRIRSTFDGAEQRLNSLHVQQWRSTSAYFNGDEVVVEIVAKPGTGVNLGPDVSFTERNPVDANAADLGGATGVPAASAVRSRKESTRDAE